MGLIKRGNRAYYYESTRVDGRVRNRLVAIGSMAEALSALSRDHAELKSKSAAEARRARERRRRWRDQRSSLLEGEREVAAVVDWALEVAAGALLAAGYVLRRGEWRKPRAKRMNDLAEIVGDEPRLKIGQENDRPTFKVERLDRSDPRGFVEAYVEHRRKAAEFDLAEQPAVDRAFNQAARHDELVALGRIPGPADLLDLTISSNGGDLTSRAEKALMRQLAEQGGFGLYGVEALRRKLAGFKADLLGSNPGPIERVLVDTIGLAYLDCMGTEELVARKTQEPMEVLEFLDRRRSRATKRLQTGLKTLALIRRKGVPNTALQVNFELERGGRPAVLDAGGSATPLAGPEALSPEEP